MPGAIIHILLACLVLASAATIVWLLFFAGRHRFAHTPATPASDKTRGTVTRETVLFAAEDGTRLEGWLYLPHNTHPPLIVMAPGLAGTKEGPLEAFAWGFAAAGYAVLSFDFRSFGGSEGLPRHHVDPRRQLADYRSAIAFARRSLASRIDADTIVLWGTSFSGSAAITAAAHDSVAAVIAQVPYLGGTPVYAPTRLQIARYITLAIAEMIGDAILKPFGVTRPPAYITAYGKPGEATFAMSTDNPSARTGKADHPFWTTMPNPQRGGWENLMLVRGLQGLDAVTARDDLKTLRCPVLLIGAMRDDLIAFEDLRKAATDLPTGHSRFVQYNCAHFDPYVAPLFDTILRTEIDFVEKIVHPTS